LDNSPRECEIGTDIWQQISQFSEDGEMVQHVARLVSCLPTTQVTVERMFSQLKLIMRENRSRMNSDLAEAIVFLRTNKCV
jgi:hypothetical protein